MPHELKNKILYQRKYIFSTHEVATRLCYIGVLQFGPQKLKEKDQVFIFVNRKASLYDTMTSRPGYHQVEEKEYPKREYNFETIGDVEKYWFEMKQICVSNQLFSFEFQEKFASCEIYTFLVIVQHSKQ